MVVDEPLTTATLHHFRDGDAAAFMEIMQKYQPLIRGAVARYFRSEFEREEAMHEIWLHVFQKRKTLDPTRRESFSGWLAVLILIRRRYIELLCRLPDSVDESEASALLRSMGHLPKPEHRS